MNIENGKGTTEPVLNGAPPVEIRPLTKAEYLKTISGQLTDVTALTDAVADVWAYVYAAGPAVQVSPQVFYDRLVENVFRTKDGRYDQVLIPSVEPNVFVSVIVDRHKRKVRGHYVLNFNK